MLLGFLREHGSLIAQHPARAVSALGDLSADRAQLLIGARDILFRPEWRELLGTGQASPTVRAINSRQLQGWISATFSATTASPWLEALQTLTGQPADTPQARRSEQAGGGSRLAGHLGIAAGCAVLTALAIALIQQPWKGNVPATAPDRGATSSPQPVAGDGDGAGPGTAAPGGGPVGHADQRPWTPSPEGTSPGEPAAGGGTADSSGSAAHTTAGPGRPPSAAADATPGPRNPGGSGRREVLFPQSEPAAGTPRAIRRHQWPQLQASLENGETRPNDWLIPEAQGRLSHWIQRLDWRGGALTIRLRTHEAVSPAICKAISQLYQRQFSPGSRSMVSVLIESTRHAGKDSVSGFLPVCRLTAGGSFSQLS